jgi:hypothetical protein
MFCYGSSHVGEFVLECSRLWRLKFYRGGKYLRIGRGRVCSRLFLLSLFGTKFAVFDHHGISDVDSMLRN